MSDAFDRKMQAIATRAAANGGPSPQDLLEAMSAGHEAAQEAAAELATELAKERNDVALQLGRISSHLESEAGHIDAALRAHFKEAASRDERLLKLELAASACPALVATAKRDVIDEHKAFHKEYLATLTAVPVLGLERRKTDAPGESYEDARRTYLMWVVGSKVGYVALAVLVAILVMAGNYIFFGHP
jgi:hypothetical protein